VKGTGHGTHVSGIIAAELLQKTINWLDDIITLYGFSIDDVDGA
jgi:hypothetical protein